MKNFVKENWFKISALVIFLVLGYSLFVFIENEKLSSNRKDCRNIAEEYRKNEIKEFPNLSFFAPEYTYSRDLDICIYSGGFLDMSILNNNSTRYIKNLNTNEEIISSSYVDGNLEFGVNNFEFAREKEKLFK